MEKQIYEFLQTVEAVGGSAFDSELFGSETNQVTSERPELVGPQLPTTVPTTSLESIDNPISVGNQLNPQADFAGSDESVFASQGLSSQSSVDAASNYRASLLDYTTPFISINDGIGAGGSRAFGESLNSIASIGDQDGNFCAGTLIAPNVLISARHCNISSSDQVTFGSNLPNPDLTVGIQSVSLPGGPEDAEEFLDGDDVALVFLDSDVPASVATPLRLSNQTSSLVGQAATIAGYGFNGTGSVLDGDSVLGDQTADGFRWGGQNVIDFYGEFGGGQNLFLADFDDGSESANVLGGGNINSNAIPLEFEAIVAGGDSGSPLLVEQNGELVVAAVSTGGLVLGFYGDFAFWTGVSRFESQIQSAGGEFQSNGGGGSGGGNGELPASDDHSNSIQLQTTGFEFVDDGTRLIARDLGSVGFGTNSFEDRDVFRFETTNRGRIIVDARARSNGFDSTVQVLDTEGNIIASNDDSENPNAANPNDSQLILRNADAGEYFVVVGGSEGSTGDYRVTVRTNANVSNELTSGGDRFNDPIQINLDPFAPTTFLNASVESSVDNDFYRFVARGDGQIVVRTKALSGNLNTVLRGLDSDRNLLDTNNNFGDSLDSRIGFNVQRGETYTLRLNSVGTTQGDYRISLRFIGDNSNDEFDLLSSSPLSARDSDQFADLGTRDTGILASV